ncbi:hypothetical protein DM01DRAFT_1350273 [Hesseltinella vesiculosa]|uniref:Uncharacterized protein n=1 Tax=Hesseltinella vesiculosa TaxID=101127 RepID=A0A1X2G268_9FUNG|nr:hypothetical protein DM01DRAFT_1350273 [Hesseltinella vesiculosa]
MQYFPKDHLQAFYEALCFMNDASFTRARDEWLHLAPLQHGRGEWELTEEQVLAIWTQAKIYRERTGSADPRAQAERRRQEARQAGRRKKKQDQRNPNAIGPCKACGNMGHMTAASHACPMHKVNKADFLREWMPGHVTFARKVGFDAVVNLPYALPLKRNIEATSKCVKNILVRVQIFLNHFALSFPDEFNNYLICTNGLYSLTQLVYPRSPASRNDPANPITSENTRARLPPSLLSHWMAFARDHPSIRYDPAHFHGHKFIADTLTPCLDALETAYTNCLAEKFDRKVKRYIKFLFAVQGQEVPRLNNVVDDLYQLFAEHTTTTAENNSPSLDVPHPPSPSLTHPSPSHPHDISTGESQSTNTPADEAIAIITQQVLAMKPPGMGLIDEGKLQEDPTMTLKILIQIASAYQDYKDQENENPVKDLTSPSSQSQVWIAEQSQSLRRRSLA